MKFEGVNPSKSSFILKKFHQVKGVTIMKLSPWSNWKKLENWVKQGRLD